MTSHTPLDTDNWQYVDNYFKNPGDYSYDKHYAFDHHYRFFLKRTPKKVKNSEIEHLF